MGEVTAPELAAAIGFPTYHPVNRFYGRLGYMLLDVIGRSPFQNGKGGWRVLSRGRSSRHGFIWTMHPELAQALEELGLVVGEVSRLAEEVDPEITYPEGAVRRVMVNSYERSTQARGRCIAHYGARCVICEIDLGMVYGAVAEGFIHVHHLRQLSELEGEYEVDPIADLRPVCPNCHAIIHRRTPPYSIEEMRALLARQ